MNSGKGLEKGDTLSKWALGVLVVLFVLWQVNHLEGFNWGYDEGVHLMIARLVWSGYKPYSEVSATQGPLFVYSVALGFGLLGTSAAACRLVTVFYAIIGLMAVALAARELGGWLSGLFAVVLLMLAPEFVRLSKAAMADVPAISLAALAILSSLRYLTTGRRSWLILAGLTFGLGCLIKLAIAPALLPLGLAVLYFHTCSRRPRSWRVFVNDLVTVLVMAILPGLLCLWVLDFRAAYEQLIVLRLQAARAFPLDAAANARWLGQYLLDNVGLSTLAVWGTLLLLARRSPQAVIVFIWDVIILLALIFHSPFFFHHMSYLLFPMAILGGCVMGDLAGRLHRPWQPITTNLTVTWRRYGLLLIDLWMVTGYVFTLPATVQADRKLSVAPGTTLQMDAVHFISSVTWPEDWVLTDDQAVAFWADRNVPPPLAETSFLRITGGWLTDQQLIALTKEYEPQAVASLSGRFDLLPHYLDWAKEHYWLVKSYDEGARIYYLRKAASPPPIQHPRQEILGQQIRFLGYDLGRPPYEPEGQIYLTLYWQALDKIEEDYTVFTHLLDSEGRLRAQKDNPPVNGLLPTSAWEAGEIIQDRYIIPLDPELLPGEYQLETGMYRLETGQRLEVHGGPEGERDRILLGKVKVLE
jgi:hypothetical protein